MTTDARPWYRERWPWILMAGPAAVVVAGVITAWIAFANADPLVVKDYYRHGIELSAAMKRQQALAAEAARAAAPSAPPAGATP